MLHFYTGSHAHKIVSLLSVAGELPLSALRLLGNTQSYRNCIYKARERQEIRYGNQRVVCKLFKLLGTDENHRVGLGADAIPILDWIGAKEYYMETFWNNHLPSNRQHLDRRFRVAETLAFCMGAGVEFRSHQLPQLQDSNFVSVIHDYPVFYSAKGLKKIGGADEMAKFKGTRMIGLIPKRESAYVVYNTRDAVMKWVGSNESKAKDRITDLLRLNYGIKSPPDAICLGNSFEIAEKLLLSLNAFKGKDLRFDSVYEHVYFLPLNDFGMEMLRILLIPGHEERVLSKLFPNQYRAPSTASFDYDACVDGKYMTSFLSGDVAKLIRFGEGVSYRKVAAEVVCYPEQVKLVRNYFGSTVGIRTLSIQALSKALGIKRRDVFEKG